MYEALYQRGTEPRFLRRRYKIGARNFVYFQVFTEFTMSILAWFRGLFGKPTKKRQVVDTKRIYATYTQDYVTCLQESTPKYNTRRKCGKKFVVENGVKWQKITDWPPLGPLNEDQAKFMFARFATSTPSQVARKLNKIGYLTPRGKKWTAQTVRYWRQSNQTLEKRREYWRQYDKKRRQPQTVIFRNADLRPRQNGIN